MIGGGGVGGWEVGGRVGGRGRGEGGASSENNPESQILQDPLHQSPGQRADLAFV